MNRKTGNTPAQRARPDIEALYREAMQSLEQGRLEDGIERLKEASRAAPRNAQILVTLAAAYFQWGDAVKAEENFESASRLEPGNPAILNNYAAFLLRLGQVAKARPLLERARVAGGDRPEILATMGLLLYKEDDLKGAEEHLLNALKANPALASAHSALGHVLRATGRKELAEKAYQCSLKIDPYNSCAVDLANLSFETFGKEGDGIELLIGFVARNPRDARARLCLVELLERASRVAEARPHLQEALRLMPSNARLMLVQAKLLRRDGKAAEAAAVLEGEAASVGEEEAGRRARFYELGRLYDTLGEVDKAFEAFSEGNRLRAAQYSRQAIDPSASSRFIARAKAGITADLVSRPGLHAPEKSPVFLVGFPRSGTTLLDQILSSHSDVLVAEEKPVISMLIKEAAKLGAAPGKPPAGNDAGGADYPACLKNISDAAVELLRKNYFDAHSQFTAAGQRNTFIDKMPLNMLHADLIKLLFPKARFIVALRHPCDAVLSFFMQDFLPSVYMGRSLDLQDAARFYDEAFTLWEHYRNVLDLDVHPVHYEDVVADFRPTVESVLSYLGLPWNDAVLEYDKTAKAKVRIRTPSYHQVTQKIYTRSSGRWLRYRKHLEPILPLLEPHILKYGYKLE